MPEPGALGEGRGFSCFWRVRLTRRIAMPFPKPAPDSPHAHLLRLRDELAYLIDTVNKIKGVQAGMATDVASAAGDLAVWLEDRLTQGVQLR